MPTTPNPQNPRPDQWPTGGVAPLQRAGGPTPEGVREQLRLFLILLLGLIIVVQLPLPFRLGGLVLAAAAGWVGIRLLIAMGTLSRAGTAVRGWPSVIIGLGLTGVLTLVLGVQAALYPIIVEQERCLSGANTLKAKASCDQIYQDRLDRLTNLTRR